MMPRVEHNLASNTLVRLLGLKLARRIKLGVLILILALSVSTCAVWHV